MHPPCSQMPNLALVKLLQVTLHTSRVKKNLVLHKRLVQGLSVAEVVEAGEVPGSKKMTTLSCSLGSYNS